MRASRASNTAFTVIHELLDTNHGLSLACFGGHRVVRNAGWQRPLLRIEPQREQIAAVGGALKQFFGRSID